MATFGCTPKIGVEKYKDEGFFERRDVKRLASADTESTGLVHEKARLRSFGMHVRDVETRKETDKILHFMQTPKHAIYSLFAALKTFTHPKDMSKGDKPWVFANKMYEAFTTLNDEGGNTLIMGHNIVRHDKSLMRSELGINGFTKLRPFQNSRNILFDTRHLARAVHGFAKDLINVRTDPKSGFLDFSLKGFVKQMALNMKTCMMRWPIHIRLMICSNLLRKSLKKQGAKTSWNK